jgi:hypothetical protein
MVVNGAHTDEQLRSDLLIRRPAGYPARDLRLLRGEFGVGSARGVTPPGVPAGREEFPPRSLGECFAAHRHEELVRELELLPRSAAKALSAQPLPVEQVRAGKFQQGPGPLEPFSRFAVVGVGCVVIDDQRA